MGRKAWQKRSYVLWPGAFISTGCLCAVLG
jgi:hypothetical protein